MDVGDRNREEGCSHRCLWGPRATERVCRLPHFHVFSRRVASPQVCRVEIQAHGGQGSVCA